ncbi:MAG: hypothetical protein V2J12_10970 [Gammaproteobacteria bacterium]|jgi:hypothetical protein|nr:hypothetical protein [Gammaproteobacteria bacterium]
MKIDPQASRVTSIFMVLALLVMAALAWSVSRDRDAGEAAPQSSDSAAPDTAGAAP